MLYTAGRGPRHKRFSNTMQHTLISLALVAAAALTVALAVLFLPSEKNAEGAGGAPLELPQGYDVNCVTGSIPQEIFSKEFPQFDAETFTYRLNRTPYWQDGVLQDLYLENPKGNFYNMRADIALQDGSYLYRSGVITPNQYLQKAEVATVPASSTLKAVVTITIFKEMDLEHPAATFTEDIEILVLK